MAKKVIQLPLSIVLLSMASIFTLAVGLVSAFGILGGLFVEIFNLRTRISNRELKAYKIAKPFEKNNTVARPTKVFKLPLPERIRSKGVYLAPMAEKELSEARG